LDLIIYFHFYKVITVSWPGSYILRLPMLILVIFCSFLFKFFKKIYRSILSWLRIEFHNCNPSHDFHGLTGWLGFFCFFLIDFNFMLQHWLDWELYFIYIYIYIYIYIWVILISWLEFGKLISFDSNHFYLISFQFNPSTCWLKMWFFIYFIWGYHCLMTQVAGLVIKSFSISSFNIK